MADFKDLVPLIAGKPGGSMAEDMKLSSEVEESAIKKINEARDMLDAEGVDGAQFILSHVGGKRALEQEGSPRDLDNNKRMIIVELQKRMNGA